jgi:hypothetical protein
MSIQLIASISNITTIRYELIDYGANITVVKKVYNAEDERISSDTIYSTNADEFIPESDEFALEWSIDEYINEFLSYTSINDEDKEYVKEGLKSSRLRYKLEDLYNSWVEEQEEN